MCSVVNVGLAIGLTIFFFILFCVICPIVICVLIWCCVAGALGAAFRTSSRPVTQTVTTTGPPATAGVVVASTTTQVGEQHKHTNIITSIHIHNKKFFLYEVSLLCVYFQYHYTCLLLCLAMSNEKYCKATTFNSY